MSKKSKSASRDKRKKDKAARKASEKAKYEGWRDAGTNQKSKRYQLRQKRKQTIRFKSHPLGPCGNVGCLSCNPDMMTKIERQRSARLFLQCGGMY